MTVPLRPLTEKEVRSPGRLRSFFLDHPAASDVVVGVLVLAFVLLPMAAPGLPALPAELVATHLVAGLAVLVAIAWRRRWPVAVLGVVTAVPVVTLMLPASHGLPGGDAAYPFALYTVAATRGPRVSWTGFGVSLLALGGGLALGARHSTAVTGSMVFDAGLPTALPEGIGPFSAAGLGLLVSYLVVGLAFLAVGLSVYARRERVAHLVQRSYDLIGVGRQQARVATMQERSRIARELHDVVSHSLQVMITLADGAKAAAPRSPTAAAEALDQLSETGRTALAEMRRMLGVLRAEEESPLALPTPDPGGDPYQPQPTGDSDLSVLVERFRRAGLVVRWRLEDLPDHQGLRLAVFRILQESLTNVLRHAPRARAEASVAVTLDKDRRPERVLVLVRDDGGGRVTAQVGSGRGLGGMRERVAMFGGELDAGPHGAGWQVRAELDVPPDAGPRPSEVWMVPK